MKILEFVGLNEMKIVVIIADPLSLTFVPWVTKCLPPNIGGYVTSLSKTDLSIPIPAAT